MGMFDELRCRYPLPVDGANELLYQTKSLTNALDQYQISEQGELSRLDYDLEDRSDPTKPGLLALVGIATRVNERWVPEPLTGEVRFHGSLDGSWSEQSWLEFSAYFVKGKLRELHQLKGRGR
jgi:hypothetical protein